MRMLKNPPASTAMRLALLSLLIFSFQVVAAPVAQPAETLGKTHEDKELGFSIRFPKDWSFVASTDEERYIVAKFISEKLLETRKVKDWTDWGSHRPEMRIIAFTPENKELGEKKEEEEEILGQKITTITQRNPYRDFKEYTKRTSGGFYFGEETSDEVKGVPCTYLDVMMEQARPPLRRCACIYQLGDVDVAVYFEIMEEYFDQYESLFKSAFKSFRKIRRDVVVDVSSGEKSTDKMTREAFIESKTANLPSDWEWDVSKEHLVITHTDKKYTEKVAQFADSIRTVIAKEFEDKKGRGSKKEDEPAEMPIIRICASVGEFNSYCDNTSGFNSWNPQSKEVVVYDGTREGYPVEWVYSRIGAGIYWQYMGEQFSWVEPADWFMYGMGYYYSCFQKKGSSCRYVKDTSWEANTLREALRDGNIQDFRTMLSPSSKGIRSYNDYLQMGTLVCFLKSREGSKKPWKGAIDTYMESFKSAYAEVSDGLKDDPGGEEEKEGEAGESAPKPRSVFENLEEVRKNVRQKAFDATFGEWDDKDWDKLQKAWADWAT